MSVIFTFKKGVKIWSGQDGDAQASSILCLRCIPVHVSNSDSTGAAHHGQTLANRRKPGPSFQL